MKAYVVIMAAILLLPVFVSHPAQALTLERYRITETLYPREKNFNGSIYPSWALDWSPNGTYLASSRLNYSQDSMMVWDMKNGEVVFSYNKPFYQLSFSPDGKYLAAAGGINENLTVFDVQSWSVIYENYTDQKGTVSVSWAPNGLYLASGGEDATVKIIDIKTWNLTAELTISGGYNTALSWSPDGRYIAASSIDIASVGSVIIWSTETWSRIKTLYIDADEFVHTITYALTWSADSSMLFAGMGTATVHNPYYHYPLLYVWNTKNWQEVAHSVISYKDDRYVFSLSYNNLTGQIAAGIAGVHYSYSASPYQTSEVLLLDAETLSITQTVTQYDTQSDFRATFAVAFSPDGRKLAIAGPELAIYEKRPDYSPLYKYIVTGAVIVIIALLYMKRRRKNAPDIELEEREAKDPTQWRFF